MNKGVLLLVLASFCEGGNFDAYARQVDLERVDTDRAAALQLGGSCTDGTKDEDETDVDCGGLCDRCPGGKKCHRHGDCRSGYCDPALSTCVAEKDEDACSVGEWSDWTKCSRACGTGEKKRVRHNDGPTQVCPHNVELVVCNENLCKGGGGLNDEKAQEDQGAINELDKEFSVTKNELSAEMAQMHTDMKDSNEDPQALEKAGELNAKEQKTMETLLQTSSAVKALKFDEEEINIVKGPHPVHHGNGQFSSARGARPGEHYCPGPVIEKCRHLAMGGPKCVRCMQGLSRSCMGAQTNTLCYASGSGDNDYQVTPTQAFDAAVATGKPEPGDASRSKSTLSKQCWAAATESCKYDPDGPDGDDDENRVQLGGDACERCVLTKLPNKCARYVRSRPKFSKMFCNSLFAPGAPPSSMLRGSIPIRHRTASSVDDDIA